MTSTTEEPITFSTFNEEDLSYSAFEEGTIPGDKGNYWQALSSYKGKAGFYIQTPEIHISTMMESDKKKDEPEEDPKKKKPAPEPSNKKKDFILLAEFSTYDPDGICESGKTKQQEIDEFIDRKTGFFSVLASNAALYALDAKKRGIFGEQEEDPDVDASEQDKKDLDAYLKTCMTKTPQIPSKKDPKTKKKILMKDKPRMMWLKGKLEGYYATTFIIPVAEGEEQVTMNDLSGFDLYGHLLLQHRSIYVSGKDEVYPQYSVASVVITRIKPRERTNPQMATAKKVSSAQRQELSSQVELIRARRAAALPKNEGPSSVNEGPSEVRVSPVEDEPSDEEFDPRAAMQAAAEGIKNRR
jgi:hypothetical protein